MRRRLSASDRTTGFESPLRSADTTVSSMKWFLILAILFGAVNAAPSAEESLGTKIKRVLEPDSTPTPSRKHRKHSTKKPTPTPSPTASPRRKEATPTPTPKSKSKRKKASPTPAPGESPSETETPSASPAESPNTNRGKKGWPNVSLSPDAIEDYEKYPPKVRQILDAGLALTKQNLTYTYGSADPANGGMLGSGFEKRRPSWGFDR